MKRFIYISVAGVLPPLVAAPAQQPVVPIRQVSAPTAVTPAFQSLGAVQEIAGGRLLVDASGDRQLLLFDANFGNRRVLADTTGTVAPYPRFVKLVRYLGDSLLMVDLDSRSLLLIKPDGSFGSVMAPPRPADFNGLTSGGPVGTDARGRLIYQSQRPFRFPPSCSVVDGQARRSTPTPSPLGDSVAIIRGDFETRTVDTVARSRVAVAGLTFPITTSDANCKVTAAKVRIDPSVPQTDAWTVTSDGTIAIVRGHDYHVDWIGADGRMHSSPKMPYDWRRLTDADKKAKVDSAKRIADSLTALGGFRMQVCGNSSSFNMSPPPAAADSRGGSGGGSGGGGGGGGVGGGGSAVSVAGGGRSMGGGDGPPPAACQNLTVAAEFPAPDEMADYIAPMRDNAARADRDGNVWILPTTSAGASGGLLYDVVNPRGELVERVQLPAQRDIAGFGKGGVIILVDRTNKDAMKLERVTIKR